MRSMSLSFNVDYSTAFPTSLVYILRRADTMDEENRTDHKKDTINYHFCLSLRVAGPNQNGPQKTSEENNK